ncbi:DUF4160 domain-containing protein [Thiomicrorhabdus aquaedulcis]|uniref:DUF4160 domain-containing protein n=1 Tax=Thiomicrorhabdus aquaedulcis TaxID=2211106 RepID=UPI0018D5A0B0
MPTTTPPAHVHIVKENRWAKIDLQTLQVIYSTLNSKELKKALELTKQHQTQFKEKWNEWFSR